MAYADIVEISTRGLRYTHMWDDNITFGYEDGRKIQVTFTSARTARKCFEDHAFIDPDITACILDGVTGVEYSQIKTE